MTLESLLPAYKFCGDNGLNYEKEKIKKLLNVYLNLAIKEHQAALEQFNKPTLIGPPNEKETEITPTV